jgi:hypothetical protein
MAQPTPTGRRWIRVRPRALAAAGGLLAAVAVVAACEHARHARGGGPWPASFLRRMADPAQEAAELAARMAPPAPRTLPEGFADIDEYRCRTSAGCMSCHGRTDDADMHTGSRNVTCVGCHGGAGDVRSPLLGDADPCDPAFVAPAPPGKDDPRRAEYVQRMLAAHVPPRNPEAWYGRSDLLDGRGFGSHGGHGGHGEHGEHGEPAHGSRTPQGSYALLNQESPEFIRFVNPGDLRVAEHACGACHPREVSVVGHGMMRHGAMLWAAALYNNGAVPEKAARYGESYSAFGMPQRLQGVVGGGRDAAPIAPTDAERARGVLERLDPLPPWNVAQPGNILRIFERGTRLPLPGGATPNPSPSEIANPNPLVEGGRPDKGLSPRGLGTLNRTDPVFLGLQKTRLLDPTLNFMGTNDHPGDFRASGCSGCHVVYANDRDPAHSGAEAGAGHLGQTRSVDPTIPAGESGHPIRHAFTSAIPSSQCITCHIHPGTSYANTYLGYMWWDNESDGAHMYPARSRTPTPDEEWLALARNPEGAQLRGLWGNLYPDAVSHAGAPAGPDFLERTGSPEFNAGLEHNQFADFHGHGWMFRAVHKMDRRGNLLDVAGEIIDPAAPDKWKRAVHLQDVHLSKHGMHCLDCHFEQDSHGDGRLYGEVRNAVEITCVDCHGTYGRRATLRTSGPAAPWCGECAGLGQRRPGCEECGNDLRDSKVSGRPARESDRFYREDGKVFQRSALDPERTWEVTQTVDTIDPGSEWARMHPEAAAASRLAKTVQRDGTTWGDLPPTEDGVCHQGLAHGLERMECYTCHTSWMTSCFGCHLPMQANRRTPMLHNESLFTRNYTQYNYQVLRNDVFMLGHDGVFRSGAVDGAGRMTRPGRIVPVRSSSAVVVSSQNQNREWIYHQQQTVSAEGYSGQAFNPHYPHAVSGPGTTKGCTDCHASRSGDNNAWMAQLLLQGTGFVNFMGRYLYVATGREGLEAVAVTEHDEPQAVYGSHLHALAYPDEHQAFVRGGRRLGEAYDHGAGWDAEILDVQVRGEYLYAARGAAGFLAYDVANIDNKGFSQRIVTAPVSPLGQRLGFDTSYAVAVAAPTTLAVDPVRMRLSSDPAQPVATLLDEPQPWHVNREQAVHPLYAYLYIGDREEGLILTGAATLLDGDPRNNFLERARLEDGSTAFNPDGLLGGLSGLTLAGHFVYATTATGLVIIDIDQPLRPRVAAVVGAPALHEPRAVAVQFRYAFVTDARGLQVIDVTDPDSPRPVPGASVPLADAQRLYLARTWALVAAGGAGLAIVDITTPEAPRLERLFDAGGRLNDARDVKAAMTNASLFAYVADGRNGVKVLELMGPHTTARFRGFAPPLEPRLIAERRTGGPALALSRGLDRDRAADESGNQIAVFGRVGARPLSGAEMRRLYLRDGALWTVVDGPESEPMEWTYEAPEVED